MKRNCLFLTMVVFVVAVFFVLQGCTPDTNQEPQAEVVELLRIGTLGDHEPVNLFSSRIINRLNYEGLTHSTLLKKDRNLNFVPCLAEKWEVSDDGREIVFQIVQDAYWHDGKPVTVEDVAFSVEFTRDVRSVGMYRVVERVDILDNNTVKITLNDSSANRLMRRTMTGILYILPKHIWENIEDANAFIEPENLIGSGPFIFERYDTLSQTSYYKANENYFAGKPNIEKLAVRAYGNQEAIIAALKNNEIDAFYDYGGALSASYASVLENLQDVDPGMVDNLGSLYLDFNNKRSPTNSLPFREAVSFALDYELISNVISGGYGEVPGRGIIAPGNLGFDPTIPKLYKDIDKAKSILDEADFRDYNGDGKRQKPDGSELRVMVTSNANPGYEDLTLRLAEVIIKQLGEIGVDAYLDQEIIGNRSRMLQRVWEDKDYDLYLGYITLGVAAAEGAALYFADTGERGFGTVTDPEYVGLYEGIIQATTDEEYESYIKAVQKYHARELPGLALSWDKEFYPYRNDQYEGWVIKRGVGPINYETWFSLHKK